MEEATVSLLLNAAMILLLNAAMFLHADADPRERPLLAPAASAADASEILPPPVNQVRQPKHPTKMGAPFPKW